MIYGCYFDPDKTLNRIKELESIMTDSDFWNDKKSSEAVINELNYLKDRYKDIYDLRKHIIYNIELLNSIKVSYDKDIYELLNDEIKDIDKTLNDLEIKELLDGPYDNCECILEIHPGAGGTESCDWANMLLNMYENFCNIYDYKYELISINKGEEAGIKSALVKISGEYAYGYLKNEAGVHRLVRISPFDANKRRHTSFAAVTITPEFLNNINIEIKESDLKIDVYHSSGAGGQSVNTSNSAVRITHIPTGIVVTCQEERSQLKNKDKAMKMLKIKMYDDIMHKQEMEVESTRKSKVGTGDRSEKIRTYNYPQNRVTDHRINFSIMELDRVMNGNLDPIIEALITEDMRLKLAGEK